jgi:hypothetical protein
MAIKPQQEVVRWENGFYLNEAAEKGVIVVLSTAGSGNQLDGSASVCTVAGNSSGTKPLGALNADFVSIDQTRYDKNRNKMESVVGDKAPLIADGWLVTNKVISCTAGSDAVLGSSGSVFTKPAVASWNQVANPHVGKFLSGLDEDGYARLYVGL